MGKRRRCIAERKGKGAKWLCGKEIKMGLGGKGKEMGERRWGEVGPLKRKYIGGSGEERRKDKMVVRGNIYTEIEFLNSILVEGFWA